MHLNDSLRTIKGVGQKAEEAFARKGMNVVQDLLNYYPYTYDEYENIVPVNSLRDGEISAIEVTMMALPQLKPSRRVKRITCRMHDDTGEIEVVWFNMAYLYQQLKMGKRYILRGKVDNGYGHRSMVQPKILDKQEFLNQLHKWQPIYSEIKGLTNTAIQKAVREALSQIEEWPEELPSTLRSTYSLCRKKKAWENIHFPKNKEAYEEAKRRLVFDELFIYSLMVQALRGENVDKSSFYVLNQVPECEDCINNLPYQLTNAQLKVWDEIKADLGSGKIMNRLVQGDVGSGKTIVAALALMLTAKNGCQGAIMVPTEVLASQHYESFQKIFEPYQIKTELLVGSTTKKQKDEILARLKSGETQVIIGTHALIQDKVVYNNLALVITDEQHRFGVKQRDQLFRKGNEPHILVMSATPIPRTLANIMYGDMDISIINEMPSNRLRVKNCVVGTDYRPQAYKFILEQIKEGHQAYIICPMVSASETMEAENVEEYSERLMETFPSDVCVEYLHGKMKAEEKAKKMELFAANKIHVLVSTTVIEVGINVPNATVILIENAERFGLAGLHQLRGRVGRGDAQSYCILMSGATSKNVKERLDILNRSNDGFYIASEDLKMRGQGDLFGVRQSGEMDFRLADIFRDMDVLEAAATAAKDPEITKQIDIDKLKAFQYIGK